MPHTTHMSAEAPKSLFDTSSEAQARRARLRHGDRSKLANMAVQDLCEVWDEQGISAVRRMAFHDYSGFVKVVTALMPQKLEITHPTDGLSDERLAMLLELAQHMATLKGRSIDEKRLIDITPEAGGGDRDGTVVAAGEGVPSTPRTAENPAEANSSNRLEIEPLSNAEALDKLKFEKQLRDISPPIDSTARLIAEESEYAMQPPVGKPCPTMPEAEKRANLKKLNDTEDDDIDPASLF